MTRALPEVLCSSRGMAVGLRSALFALFVLPAALCAQTDQDARETKEQAKAEPAKAVFKDGMAQVVDAFKNKNDWIQHDLWVETEFDSDGDGRKDRVHVDVSRPRQTETEGLKVPVIYETSPYYAGTSTTNRRFFWDPKHAVGTKPPERPNPPPVKQRIRRPLISRSHINAWVPRGFAVVHSSSPGTGLSQGCPTVGGANESLAPKAVIDWLCGRAKGYTSADGNEEVVASWSTGKVGMTGTSYNGTLPLAAATTGVEGLEAIIPIAPNTSYYHYYRSHGLVRHPGGWMGEDIDVLFNFIHSGDPDKREYCNCEVRDKIMLKKLDRITGDYSDWWEGRNYRVQLAKVKAAVLMAHAFNDWNVMPEHSVEVYEQLKKQGVPCMAYFHQGGHGGPPPFELMNKWFTRYLYGVDNGVEKLPRSWIVREGAQRNQPTAYPDYPHPKASFVRLHLRKGGSKVGALALKAEKGQGVEELEDDVAFTGAQLAMAEGLPHRLIYATAPLQEALHISGTARIKIRLSSSKKAANLSVWLVSLPWSRSRRITDNVITRGWADPQNRESMRKSTPLVPDKFYELGFTLQPDDQVIPKGQRIGLMIFSSDREFTLWPPRGTKLTVDLDSTWLELPVVGGEDAYRTACEVDR